MAIDCGPELRLTSRVAFPAGVSLIMRRFHLFGPLVLASTMLVAASAAAQGGETQPPPAAAPSSTAAAPTPATTAPAATGPAAAAPSTEAPSTEAPATTAPSIAAPATTAPSSAAPTTSPRDVDQVPALFTSTLTSEKDKASGEKPKETLRWAGTQYFQQLGVSPDVFNPGQTQCAYMQCTTVDTFALFQPRFSITKDWQLRLRMVASYEFTDNANASSVTRSNEIQWGDILPSLVFKGIPAFAGVHTIVGVGAGLPTSAASQARTMLLSPYLNVAFQKVFEKTLGGDFQVIFSTTYSHPFYRYTTAGLANEPSYQPQCFGAGDTGCGLQATGVANTSDSLSFLLSADITWGNWDPGFFFLLRNGWAYTFSPLAGVQPEPGGSTNFRQDTYFNVFLDYNVNSWFTGEIGYQMSRASILTGQSTIGNPFYDPYQDMRVYLGFNIGLDKLYEAVRGVNGEAGILRVKNERKPMFTF